MLNNLRKLFLFVLFLYAGSLSLIGQEVTYEGEKDGVIMLSVFESNVNKKDAVSVAIKDAYFHILFRGIPGSTQNRNALLGTDEYAPQKRQYYDDLINGERLYSFITYSNLDYYKRREGISKKVAVIKLSVNVKALISDLERKNLYRRFGLY